LNPELLFPNQKLLQLETRNFQKMIPVAGNTSVKDLATFAGIMKTNLAPAQTITTPAATELLVRCQALLGQPVNSEELMELVMQLLAQELIAAKLQGKAISDNLKLLGYLMRYASLKLRAANLRLREQKTAAKSATSKARPDKPASASTRSPSEAPPHSTPPKPSLEDKAYMESLLEQYGYLPKERPDHKNDDFNIDSKIIAFPGLGETPLVTPSPSQLK
jgi:hypothetical protein